MKEKSGLKHRNFSRLARSIRGACLVLATLLALGAPRIDAAGNHLDYSFGNDGLLPFTGMTNANDVAVQDDGKVIIVGSAAGNFMVARLNSDGSLDTSFAGDGTLAIDFGGGGDAATSVVIQPDGKIVVGGWSVPSGSMSNFAVARVSPSGILDLGFSDDGRATFDFQNGADYARAIALIPNGKIVLVGDIDNSLGWGVVQLNANGTPDTTFSTDGKVLTDIGGSETATDVVIRTDGKIVVCGTTLLFGSTDTDIAIARYNTNGTLDTTFDGDGKFVDDYNGLNNHAHAMKQMANGNLVIAGQSEVTGGYSAITVARYTQLGVPDPTFGGTGVAFFNLDPNGSESARDLVLNNSGDIVLAGLVTNPGSGTNIVLVRVLNNGRLDPKFGTNGRVDTVFFSFHHLRAEAITTTSTGKFVAAGTTTFTQASIETAFVARYNLSGSAAHGDMTGDAVADYAVFRPSTGVNWILDSQALTNTAMQFGANGDVPAPGDYDRDGKVDVAVFRPSQGAWYVLRSSNFSYFAAPFGTSTDKPVQGDYDGDGQTDIAVYRPSTGTWYINQTFDNEIVIKSFGTAEDKPAPADYDADGLADLAVFRPSSGTWHLSRSKLGNMSTQFGIAGDRPVPADYDGDNRADIAVWRPSTGAWYVYNSQSNAVTSALFGAGGDVPAPANFDYDGKADFAVFRPSTGVWYVQKSLGGIDIVPFGTNGDIPLWSRYVPE